MFLKGFILGEISVIGADSLVINYITKDSITIGNPCKVVSIKNWDATPK
jgi:acetyltransferase-like isoleucine patch superfamily enzyme